MSLIQEPEHKDLTGRIISLNLHVCKRFQCGGFALGPARPFSVVEPTAQQGIIRQGLIDGRLLDITDQNIQGVSIGETSHSPAHVLEEKGKKVYLQINQDGSLTVIAPKDEADEAKREEELATMGVLIVNEDEVEVAKSTFDQSGKIDTSGAEQLITSMAEVIDMAKSKQSHNKVN